MFNMGNSCAMSKRSKESSNDDDGNVRVGVRTIISGLLWYQENSIVSSFPNYVRELPEEEHPEALSDTRWFRRCVDMLSEETLFILTSRSLMVSYCHADHRPFNRYFISNP